MIKDTRPRAIGYMRVSTDAQAGEDRYGLEEQKEAIMEYASKNRIYIIDWFIDKGVSGTVEDRPAMNQLLYSDIGNPPIEYVIVAKSDRVARDIKLYYYYLMLMEKKGMKLVSVSEPVVDDGTGMGNIYKALMLFVAEQERKNIAMRTRGGRKQKALCGGYSGGRPPYGYRAFDGELVVVPYEGKIIRKIFELSEAGIGLSRISKLFNENGIPTRSGKRWTPTGVSNVLKYKDFYEGKYEYGSVETVGKHEPLIVDGIWNEKTDIIRKDQVDDPDSESDAEGTKQEAPEAERSVGL